MGILERLHIVKPKRLDMTSFQRIPNVIQIFEAIYERIADMEHRIRSLELDGDDLRNKVLRKIQRAKGSLSKGIGKPAK